MMQIEPLFVQTVAGRKNMTRRSGGLDPVNYRIEVDGNGKEQKIFCADDWRMLSGTILKVSQVALEVSKQSPAAYSYKAFVHKKTGKQVLCKPRYIKGEICYLKEPWGTYTAGLRIKELGKGYGPDNAEPVLEWTYYYGCQEHHAITEHQRIVPREGIKFGNKMFMPKDCPKRVFIQITDIKCERLLDISDQDCIAEGIETSPTEFGINDMVYRKYGAKVEDAWLLTPQQSFLSLYRHANKVKEVPNLWVWVYSYKYLPDFKMP